MTTLRLFITLACLILSGGCQFSRESTASAPQLLSVQKIWDARKHNAFTDLIRYKGNWFCTFREAEAHVGGDGKIRVITSTDGKQWKSSALLAEEGIDLRDPKLSITPDQRLMMILGGSVYEGKTLKGRQPRVSFSDDGIHWSAPQRVAQEGDWLWRVTWHKGRAYGISYAASGIKLLASNDGIHYELVTKLDVPDYPNEATLRFLPNDDCVALVRRERNDKQAWIGRSSPPYKDWQWQPAGMQIGGPDFLILNNKKMIASGRQYRNQKWEDSRTFIGRMDFQSVEPELILPSGGDTSYPRLVWHDKILWVSYYSSHEGRSSIYLAKVKLNRR